jgi:TolB-like protein
LNCNGITGWVSVQELIQELKRRNVFRVGVAYLALAWLVIQVTDMAVPALNLPETLNSIVFYIGLVGFPFALFFAWVFELTPEGLKIDGQAGAEQAENTVIARRLTQFTIGMLALALGFVTIDQYILEERDRPTHTNTFEPGEQQAREATAAEKERSIAVLPFRNRSANADDAYFVDGIHDDILTQLTRVAALDKVISRTSVERYRNTELPIPKIARELAVSTILEGAVQRAGSRVRINMQLIDAASDEHLWAETYDRELTPENLFAIQSEIALAVVNALEATLSATEKSRLGQLPTDNLEALEQYFLSRQSVQRSGLDDFSRARKHLERAVELDPGFALAWAELGRRYMLTSFLNNESSQYFRKKAFETVGRAMALDPGLGEAFLNLGVLHLVVDDFEEGEFYLARARELIPNSAEVLIRYSNLRFQQGNMQESAEYFRAALARAPVWEVLSMSGGNPLLMLGKYEEARGVYRDMINQRPNSSIGYWGLSTSYWQAGRWDEAVPWQRKALAISPYAAFNGQFHVIPAMLHWEMGDNEEAFCLALKRFEKYPELFSAADGMTWAWLIRGDRDKAMKFARLAADLAVSNHLATGIRPAWLNQLRDEALAGGSIEVAEVRQIYAAAFPQLFQPELPPMHFGLLTPAVDLLPLLQHTGEQALAARLVQGISEAMMSSTTIAGAVGADMLVMQGKFDEAVATLRQIVELTQGHSWLMLIKYNTNLAPLHTHPGYQALVAELEAKGAQQRTRLHATETSKDTCRDNYITNN